MSTPQSTAIIDIYNKILASIQNKALSPVDLLQITTDCINLAQRYNLPGEDKKAIVLAAVNKIVSDTTLIPPQDKPMANMFCSLILPVLIDVVVSVAQGSLSNFAQEAESKCASCLPTKCSCL